MCFGACESLIFLLFSSAFIRTYSDNSDSFVQVKEKYEFQKFSLQPENVDLVIIYVCNDFKMQLVIGWPHHSFCKTYSLHHFTKGLPWKLTFI